MEIVIRFSFLAYVWLFIRVLERGKFLCNKMAELVTEVEESVEDGFSFDLYAKLLREGTLTATNRRRFQYRAVFVR